MVRVKGSFCHVKVIFSFIFLISRHQEIEYLWRESSDRSTLRGIQGKSSLEQGDEITTDDDHHLMPERCLTDEEAEHPSLCSNHSMGT